MKSVTPVTETELHAYVDDRLPSDRRAAVENHLATHPGDAERVRDWRQQRVALHALFDPVLEEPVPDSLRRRPSRPGLGPLRYVAFVATALIGGALGWALRGEQVVIETVGLPQQAAVAHVVYAPEVLHPVEVGAREEAHLVQWLSKRLGAPVRAPQLTAAGFELIGGRLLPGDAGPAAQFMYQDVHGARLTLYVRQAVHENGETAFRYAQEDKVGVFYWVDGPFGYALSGELARPQLLQVAEQVYRAFNP
jgi:anti-sigma factor RsiW